MDETHAFRRLLEFENKRRDTVAFLVHLASDMAATHPSVSPLMVRSQRMLSDPEPQMRPAAAALGP
jgi:hypothetical protein